MKSFKNAGFTLIELLIVIALLGALAVGLLATVDPFEQLKKGTDTSTRNTAAEAYNAMVRYYAQRGSFPTTMSSLVAIPPFNLHNLTAESGLTEIAAAGELKNDFGNLAGTSNLARIYMSMPSSEKVIVCVNPQSKAFRNDQNTKFDISGGTSNTACPNATAIDCYVCFQ